MEPSRYFNNVSNHSNFAPLTHCLLLQDIPTEGLRYKIIPLDLYCLSLKKSFQTELATNAINTVRAKLQLNGTIKHTRQKIKIEKVM